MNKSKQIDEIFKILENGVISNSADTDSVDVTKLLTPKQMYDISILISNKLSKTDLEYVQDFHDKFKVAKEDSFVIDNFQHKQLRLSLILEESLELGFALGFDNIDLYELFVTLLEKVMNKQPDKSIKEVFDAYTDLLFVTYGGIDVMNLSSIQQEGMKNVYESNMSKLISKDLPNYLDIVKDSVAYYKALNIEVVSKDLQNGYISISNKETDKILKPTIYKKPELQTLINNLINK